MRVMSLRPADPSLYICSIMNVINRDLWEQIPSITKGVAKVNNKVFEITTLKSALLNQQKKKKLIRHV